MGRPPHLHDLPEVLPDQSPQALTRQEAAFRQGQFDGQPPMYPAVYDEALKETSSGLPGSDYTPVTATNSNGVIPWEPHSAIETFNANDQVPSSEKIISEPMILGLKRRVFWLLIGISIIVIVASVGGGVGGGIAASRSGSSGTSSSSATPTNSPSATNSVSPLPSNLANETVPSPGYSFQGYKEYNYQGPTPVIRSDGFWDMPFAITSYVWLPNNTRCCVTFCKDTQTTAADAGWRCDETWQVQAAFKFTRIWIGCADEWHRGPHSCQ